MEASTTFTTPSTISSSTTLTLKESAAFSNGCNTDYTGAIVGSIIGSTVTICLSVLSCMWLLKNRS